MRQKLCRFALVGSIGFVVDATTFNGLRGNDQQLSDQPEDRIPHRQIVSLKYILVFLSFDQA